MTVPVLTASEASALDSSVISSGTPSFTLMQRAGEAAAGEIVRRYSRELARGAAVFAGSGNNGGDAWIVARVLSEKGIATRVSETAPPATADARRAKELAVSQLSRNSPLSVHPSVDAPVGDEGVVVDGILGTGASGAPRGVVADAVGKIAVLRSAGAVVASLDVPSGLNATTGAGDGAVNAATTLSFGSVKRGQLLNRAVCGRIVVLDIGLGANAESPSYPVLVDVSWALSRIPPIPADAHKGVRKRIALAGGAGGMAGAIILAARGAFHSGVGLLKLVVSPDSLVAVQTAEPQALASIWPVDITEARALLDEWPHAVAVGPGLGTDAASRRLINLIRSSYRGPMVLDADALNILSSEGGAVAIATIASDRATVVTPHAMEMARLVGSDADSVLASRFEIAAKFAKETGATVLLKGVPTLIASPDGRMNVSASGSPVLATGGSGDILAGILTTLLAQTGDPLVAASCAAWVHGRAGEISAAAKSVRGASLSDVLDALSRVWAETPAPLHSPVLAELPEVS